MESAQIVMSWNVNYNRQLEHKSDLFSQYKYTARHEHIMAQIGALRPDILCLCGASNISSPMLQKDLLALGYSFVVQKYCEDDDAAIYITAYLGYKLKHKTVRYFTATPEKPTLRGEKPSDTATANNFGEVYERSVLMCALTRNDETLIVCNVHMPLNYIYNTICNVMLPGFVKEFMHSDMDLNAISAEVNTPIIIAGDFNTVEKMNYMVMQSAMNAYDFHNASDGAKYMDLNSDVDLPITPVSTYVAFPYESISTSNIISERPLDYIFTRGIYPRRSFILLHPLNPKHFSAAIDNGANSSVGVSTSSHINTSISTQIGVNVIKNYVNLCYKDNLPTFASNHLPVVVLF